MFSETAIAILDKSDFLERFSSFITRYQNFRYLTNVSSSDSWIRDKNYEYIWYYLSPSPRDEFLPFTLTDFVKMDDIQIAAWHEYCLQLKHLLDEKDSLYETLNRYHDIP